MTRDRRTSRDQPYLEEHVASARPKQPRTSGELLVWFLEGFRAETPERIHGRGVWSTTRRLDSSGHPTEDVPAAEQGGSALGAPRYAEPFRSLLENSPRQWTDERGTVDPYYVRPMRAALAKMARQSGEDSPWMARFLLQVAYAGGDWRGVAERWGIKPFAQEAFLAAALRRVHHCWRSDPPLTGPTWVERSDAQRAAEETSEPGGAA